MSWTEIRDDGRSGKRWDFPRNLLNLERTNGPRAASLDLVKRGIKEIRRLHEAVTCPKCKKGLKATAR